MTSISLPNQHELGQWFTPRWAAEAIVESYFPDLGIWDRVVEPSCGDGSFLNAIPDFVPAVGIEIDPAVAQLARRNTGRQVITGNFTSCELPFTPTAVIGNPPFNQALIQGFIERAWSVLPDEGRCGLLLPVYAFQTPSVVERLASKWHIHTDLVPRTLFARIRLPLCFAVLTKGKRGMVGLSLYSETLAVSRLQKRYRALLASGEGSVWAAVVRAAMEHLGGTCELSAIYKEIEGIRPTTNQFWQPKVRQTVQRIASRVGPGRWTLKPIPSASPAPAAQVACAC